MKLIIEHTNNVEYITEAHEGKKNLYVSGVFMEYDAPNKNGRIYPKSVMEPEVARYIKDEVENENAVGELNHPSSRLGIDLNEVSHRIINLEMRPNGEVHGKAMILETPKGLTARGLIEGGVKLGISTRGLGSLKESMTKRGIQEVQNDFRLVTAGDLVHSPSAPKAWLKGIMEGVDCFYDPKFGWQTQEFIEETVKEIKKGPIKIDEAKVLQLWAKYLETL